MDERHRQPHALPLPGREPVDTTVRKITEFERLDRLFDCRRPCACGNEREPRAQVEMATGGEPSVEATIACRKEAESCQVCAAVPFGVQAVECHRARIGVDQPGRDAQQRGLSGAVRTRDEHDRPLLHSQVDPVENWQGTPLLRDARQDESVVGSDRLG